MVGSGPNGLAAATELAVAGLSVTVLEAQDVPGGGTRTHEALGPGLLVDHCAGFHPMAVRSPALAGLDAHGLGWAWPEVDCVHPLDDGTAGVLHRSVERTAEGLGADGRRWSALFAGPARRYPELAADVLAPVMHRPSRPLLLARFGLPAALPAGVLGRVFATEQGRALFAGAAAHAMRPMSEPFSSAIGLGLLTAGQHDGWPVAVGGSQAITRAQAARLAALGGTIETGRRIVRAADLPPADVTVFDLAPGAVADILADRLPRRTQRSYRRFRRGPGTVKVDFAVHGSVPWRHPDAARAGTVHLGGTAAEIALAERDVSAGRMPQRPFTLVGQQYLADPTRSAGEVHPLYAYAQVPFGYTGDAATLITEQIERFAPGFRERILARHVTGTADFEAANANLVGGDILTGAKDPRQLVLGPRPGGDPYRTGVPGVYLCSAAAPPGPGAHGMAGYHAARRALRDLSAATAPRRGAQVHSGR